MTGHGPIFLGATINGPHCGRVPSRSTRGHNCRMKRHSLTSVRLLHALSGSNGNFHPPLQTLQTSSRSSTDQSFLFLEQEGLRRSFAFDVRGELIDRTGPQQARSARSHWHALAVARTIVRSILTGMRLHYVDAVKDREDECAANHSDERSVTK